MWTFIHPNKFKQKINQLMSKFKIQISSNIFLYQSQKKYFIQWKKEFDSTLIWVNYEGKKNPHNKLILYIMPE